MWPALLGAIVGGVLTILGAWAQAAYYREQRRKSIASAIGAEVSSLVALINVNDYCALLRSSADELETGAPLDPFYVIATQSYFCIFEANALEIGELPPRLSARIIAFYQAARSTLDTLSPGESVGQMKLHPGERADFLRRMADQVERIAALGRELMTLLAAPDVWKEYEKTAELVQVQQQPRAN